MIENGEHSEDPCRDRRAASADVRRADRGLGRGVGSIEYRPEADVHRAFYDAGTVRPSTVIIVVVSAVEDADPLDIEPIYSSVDLDALDMLLDTHARSDETTLVRFSVQGRDVTVSSQGAICVG